MVSCPGAFAWPASAAEARRLIPGLAARILAEDRLGPVRRIGGADASATRFDPMRAVHAAIVTLDWPGLAPRGAAAATRLGGLPYIPGLLGFREVPALAEAWARLDPRPDLVLVDGHGLAHPQRLGVACLLGLALDVPTIGVAKSLLVGAVDGALDDRAGARAPILHRGERIGMALRSRRGAHPILVSVGHRIGLDTALGFVEATLQGRRLPAPIRAAHDAAAAARRDAAAG
jgi:deoxyribonuclease V